MVDEERLPSVHPGEVLLEDFMKPLGLSQYRVAQDIGVPALRINQIVHGKRSISADTALRLARYDLEMAESKLENRIQQEVRILDKAQVAEYV